MPLPHDDLVVAVQVESGRIAFRLSGEIDESNADAIPHAVLAAGIEGGHVVIDLADVTFMDSSGCRRSCVAAPGSHKGVALEGPQRQRPGPTAVRDHQPHRLAR